MTLVQVRLQHLLHVLKELADDEQSGQHLTRTKRTGCITLGTKLSDYAVNKHVKRHTSIPSADDASG